MRFRDIVRHGVALLGLVMIFVPVLMMAESGLQVAWVMAGVLFIELSVWDLVQDLFPDDRVYLKLRREVDEFLDDVRSLNDYAVQNDEQGVEQVRQRMISRIDDIVEAAGKKTKT